MAHERNYGMIQRRVLASWDSVMTTTSEHKSVIVALPVIFFQQKIAHRILFSVVIIR